MSAVVIGGGFFGLYLAEHLAARLGRVTLLEKGGDLMRRASYVNQARVHHGYHYPRSLLTALRSRVNFPRFVREFPECVDTSFEKVYAIARTFSKVSARQFRQFMERIGAPVEPAEPEVRGLFDAALVEDVFQVAECAFDAVRLKDVMAARVGRAGVEVWLNTRAARVREVSGGLVVEAEGPDGRREAFGRHVFNCCYSQINQVLLASGLPLIPLKHELTEMALIDVPAELRGLGVTLMCGPFFSCMPFPPLGLHTLSHVRYTPHCFWYDSAGDYREPHALLDAYPRPSAFPHMLHDAGRYLPALAEGRYRGSLWEVKTVLPLSEADDSRPILFRRHHGLRRHHVVMGGKIDNVYDAVEELDRLLAEDEG